MPSNTNDRQNLSVGAQAIAAEAGDYAGRAAGRIADQVRDVAGSAVTEAGKLKDRAVDAMDQVSDAGRHAVRSASKQVSDHPLPSVGVAFVAGLVVGVLVDRLL